MKNITAIAMAGLAACAITPAIAQSNITLYGIIDTGVARIDDAGGSGSTLLRSGNLLTSRFGFRGTEDLGDGLKAIFNLEAGLNSDTGATSTPFFGRQSWVGLRSASFGDLMAGRVKLADFKGLAACGGFSYGDVLGAGSGWAKSILFHPELRDAFAAYFDREDTFALGVCNGCQMMSQLRDIIPGATHWPRFERNRSEQFEARFTMVEVADSPSILFRGMSGSKLPIVVSHGEGRAVFDDEQAQSLAQVAMRYIDHDGAIATRYPRNPNGSPAGITSVTTDDGRVTILMPHPERVFRTVQMSWHPAHWGEDSPWMRMFRNARVWVG